VLRHNSSRTLVQICRADIWIERIARRRLRMSAMTVVPDGTGRRVGDCLVIGELENVEMLRRS
jgi:hypothetical protein